MAAELIFNRKPWMERPTERWNMGLLRAGLAFRSENATYPPPPADGTYRRLKALAGSYGRIAAEGKTLELWSTFYWKYLMLGTGLYGPLHRMIVPVRAKKLAWTATAGPMAGSVITAFAVKGTIWPGKLEKEIDSMRKGFISGIRENHE